MQIIAWDPDVPRITCYDEHAQRVVAYPLDELSMKVYRGRFCTGSFTKEGYRPCPDSAVVGKFDQCPRCSFIPNQDCLFNPICDGEICDFPFCSEEHVVYLGFFNDLVKVGITQEDRIEKRAGEQGLDAYSIITTAETRRRAREMEQRIAKRLSVHQAPKGGDVIKRMVAGTDVDAITREFKITRGNLESMGFKIDKLNLMEHGPIAGFYYQRDVVGVHRGVVKEARGKYLFYGKYVIDGRGMVGRHVDLGII
jgi:hypothetical protein